MRQIWRRPNEDLAYPHPEEVRAKSEAEVDPEPNVEGDARKEMGEWKEGNATQRCDSECPMEGKEHTKDCAFV
jgi:hypothetical protein